MFPRIPFILAWLRRLAASRSNLPAAARFSWVAEPEITAFVGDLGSFVFLNPTGAHAQASSFDLLDDVEGQRPAGQMAREAIV